MPASCRTCLALAVLATMVVCDQAGAWVQARFIHAAPISADRNQTAISLYIAGDFSVGGFPHSYELHNIVYRNYTNFFGYPAADFDIVIRSGTNGAKLVETTVSLESGYSHWIILTGNGEQQPFDIKLVRSTMPAWDSGQHLLRFVHTAPVPDDDSAAALSILDLAGAAFSPDLGSLTYGQASQDLLAPSSSLTRFVVHSASHQLALLQPEPFELNTLRQATALLVIGDQIHQPLSMLAVPGGELPMQEIDDGEDLAVVDNSVLGWWASTSSDAGEGLLLQPIPEQQRLVGTIYTYADDESGQQRWYVLESCQPDESGVGDCPPVAGFNGRLTTATVFATEGGRLGGSDPASVNAAGWIELEFIDCDQATAYMSLDNGSTVTWELQRLTRTVPCTLD